MKTTPLQDLLQKIPPLPYKVMADPLLEGRHPYHDQRHIVTADAEVELLPHIHESYWELGKGIGLASMRDVPVGTATYLVHAANVLPELVGMLKDAELQLGRLTGENLELYARAFSALASNMLNKATNIPTA